jgi:hypothetical protein
MGKCLLLLSLGSLGACASFSAMPEPVLTTQDAIDVTHDYPVHQALRRYHAPTDADREGLSPRHWRDMVVGVYLAAADARYQEFRANLSREMRGGNFGLDVAVLGISAAGTVSGQATANALAAITGALTGTRSALSKDVYFERTLPALVASMDASRTEVATRVHTGLTKPVEEYPLERAITDVLAYERAASLDQAIQRVTVSAAVDAATQQAAFQRIERVSATVLSENLVTVRQVTDKITDFSNRQATDPVAAQNFRLVADALHIDANLPMAQQVDDAIDAVVELAATPGRLQAFVTNLKAQRGLDLAL